MKRRGKARAEVVTVDSIRVKVGVKVAALAHAPDEGENRARQEGARTARGQVWARS